MRMLQYVVASQDVKQRIDFSLPFDDLIVVWSRCYLNVQELRAPSLLFDSL